MGFWILVATGVAVPLMIVVAFSTGVLDWRPDREQRTAFVLMGLALLDLGLFFFVGILVVRARQQQGFRHLEDKAADLGLQFVKHWGRGGRLGGINLFGLGPYLEGTYGGLRVTLGHVAGGQNTSEHACSICMYHSSALGLGLYGEFQAIGPTALQLPSSAKPAFARRLKGWDSPMACWAFRKKSAEALLTDSDAAVSLKRIARSLDLAGGALVINDRCVTAMLPRTSQLTSDLLDDLCAVSVSLVTAAAN